MGGRKKNSKNHSIKTDGFKAWLNHHRTKYPEYSRAGLECRYRGEELGLIEPSYVDKNTGQPRDNYRRPKIILIRPLLDQDGHELVFQDKSQINAGKAREALVKETGLDFGEVLLAEELAWISDHNRAVRKWEWQTMRKYNRLIAESYERERPQFPRIVEQVIEFRPWINAKQSIVKITVEPVASR